jgi:hypothetical protein
METLLKVFEKDRIIGGYTVTVKDDWVYKAKKIHLSETEKDLYLEKFGENSVTFNEFYEWFKTIKKSPK